MLTVNILWVALIGALAGLAFILILPFVMAGMIVWQAIPKKALAKAVSPLKGFNLPFVEAYLSGKKRKEVKKEENK